MYASELMELVRKNPEKYEGKRYKCNITFDCYRTSYRELYVRKGKLVITPEDGGFNWAYINSNAEVEEIPTEVTLQEALQAFCEGKTVEHTHPNGITSVMLNTFIVYRESNGKWYIVD